MIVKAQISTNVLIEALEDILLSPQISLLRFGDKRYGTIKLCVFKIDSKEEENINKIKYWAIKLE